MTILALSGLIRPLLEPRLPEGLDVRWFMTKEEALAAVPEAEIGWFDMYEQDAMAETLRAATNLKWLNSIYAGLDFLPMDVLIERGITVTNGAGINALTIAEYVVMGMLNIAKGYRDVVRAQEKREWLQDSPGKRELAGSNALLLGYGAIGKLIKPRLEGFDVDVTVVRRTPGEGVLTPDQWRDKLGEFDWVILAVPATPETDGMIGAEELAAMKSDAVVVNIARGAVIDQPALVEALTAKKIGGAFLDVTTPEPLPANHPLWALDNAHITMHLSGRAQDKMFMRSADRFLDNLDKYLKGEPVGPIFDPKLGY
ncbi:D-2-hydroxyacid dehydrogenase [Altererythrobacter sp.]|uniref:D-2-hydroxyacid dehydrogenase n=1 Tax=Altererythrobacter sp. TaxID=1872480 RepID=UPI001B1A3350|nr:D-2-hydroxyacid dehydrogenase [Altererythrobacter sp.]MBO6608656.1 D-2-hydroxyacid dehydrogenase [Altererythrobacter sp.]MBO6642910.1 D-2-hydroxyacid dehydrogenase [Altererythrobacter sp.]MBO6709653.1 D-2-hydroxyacid dehydrogenase [Altererythrobacter sp.]